MQAHGPERPKAAQGRDPPASPSLLKSLNADRSQQSANDQPRRLGRSDFADHRGVLARLRQSAGQDVEAGCGQLRARELANERARIPIRALA